MPITVEWGALVDGLLSLLGLVRRQGATDLRIVDRAKELYRVLEASAEDWPSGPSTLRELLGWAMKLSSSLDVTDAAVRDLVDLRPEASNRVKRNVGRIRDDYHAMADIVNPIVKAVYIEPTPQESAAEMMRGKLRRAYALMRRCLRDLRELSVNDQ